MSLPKLNTPDYRLTIPSSDKEIKFRPFLVKEEKVLLMAQETGDNQVIFDAIKKLIENCCHGEIEVEGLPLFDIEYIFLQIRAKSLGEISTLQVTCPDDGETKVEVEVDLTKIKVTKPEGHDFKIPLTDDIGVIMAYPHFGTVTHLAQDAENAESSVENMFNMVADCMYQVWQGEEVVDAMDYSDKEKREFLESLTHDQFEKIQNFFDTMPTIKHQIQITNPKTKKKSKVVLSGMNDFF
tara:strand:+ start:948 stop:1664 length:717 start_codon:yes stop_codon:yes gene_type:complete